MNDKNPYPRWLYRLPQQSMAKRTAKTSRIGCNFGQTSLNPFEEIWHKDNDLYKDYLLEEWTQSMAYPKLLHGQQTETSWKCKETLIQKPIQLKGTQRRILWEPSGLSRSFPDPTHKVRDTKNEHTVILCRLIRYLSTSVVVSTIYASISVKTETNHSLLNDNSKINFRGSKW